MQNKLWKVLLLAFSSPAAIGLGQLIPISNLSQSNVDYATAIGAVQHLAVCNIDQFNNSLRDEGPSKWYGCDFDPVANRVCQSKMFSCRPAFPWLELNVAFLQTARRPVTATSFRWRLTQTRSTSQRCTLVQRATFQTSTPTSYFVHSRENSVRVSLSAMYPVPKEYQSTHPGAWLCRLSS